MALNEHLMRSLAPEQDTVPRASPQTSAKGRLCVEYYLSRTSVLIREQKLKWRPDPLDAECAHARGRNWISGGGWSWPCGSPR